MEGEPVALNPVHLAFENRVQPFLRSDGHSAEEAFVTETAALDFPLCLVYTRQTGLQEFLLLSGGPEAAVVFV